jgi:hypothetical protein
MTIFITAALAIAAAVATPATPTSPHYVLAVGMNDSGQAGLNPLRFADDDAVEAVRLLARGQYENARLLTVMDAETQGEARDLVHLARAPTTRELMRAVSELVARVESDERAGLSSTVHVWISGHATYDDDGHAVFPLLDGVLSAHAFLDDVVRPLSRAHRVHVFVDTCFAGALVRAKAAVKSVEPKAAETTFFARGLAGMPNVGAVVAASQASAAYEWEEVRAGVFSALTRAALRGAADADRDDVIRYSELGAFLAASTDAVALAPARPRIAVYPPAIDGDAIVLALGAAQGLSLFDEDVAALGPLSIVDGRGTFLVAAAFESGFQPRLWLPAEHGLYLRARGAEHPLTDDEGRLALGAPQEVDVRARSLVARALEEGLFKTPFGPAFYRGYRMTTVTRVDAPRYENPETRAARSLTLAPVFLFSLGGVSSVVFVGAAMTTGYFATQFFTTDTERRAYEAFAATSLAGGIAGGALIVALASVASGAVVLLDE